MSDDISIPNVGTTPRPRPATAAPSYRARRTGIDSSTRWLVMAASGLGLVLLAGMAVWTFGGHRAAVVPVIEADTRPLRIKPDNPGGMIVAGANDQVMGRGDGATAAGGLAPEAERPDPQALRAQRPITSAPAAEAPVPSPAIPMVAAVRPVVSSAAGSAIVQLAAVDSEAAAATEWQRLQHKAPELLGDRKLAVTRADRDGKVFWRVRTGGFADLAAAAEFCRKARAKGLGCSIGS